MRERNREEIDRLSRALRGRFNDEDARNLALLLLQGYYSDSICYAEIDIAPELRDDIVLLAYEERLLIPLKGSAWDDRVLSLTDSERYALPRIVRILVEKAGQSGEWNTGEAIREALLEAGESDTGGILKFINELRVMAPRFEVDIEVMRLAASELGLQIDLHEVTDRFVRCGIVSPRTGRSLYAGSSRFEINPCLCWEERS
jgi:hypothetical protein